MLKPHGVGFEIPDMFVKKWFLNGCLWNLHVIEWINYLLNNILITLNVTICHLYILSRVRLLKVKKIPISAETMVFCSSQCKTQCEIIFKWRDLSGTKINVRYVYNYFSTWFSLADDDSRPSRSQRRWRARWCRCSWSLQDSTYCFATL